jgi:glycosyltransferase involved in cell wall biosynthesis
MKVLVLSNCPLVESQGSGYVVTGYVRELRSSGHQVRAFGPEHFEWMPSVRIARTWRLAMGMALWVLRHRLHRGWDLIELYGGESWLAVLVLRLANTQARLVHHSNGLEPRISQEMVANCGSDTHDGRPRRWYQFRALALARLAYTRVDALITVSEIERQFALSAGYQPPQRVLAIETGLPPEFSGQPFVASRPQVLGFCGGWHARKGVGLVVAAGSTLLRRYPGLQLHLAGVGDAFRVAEVFPVDVADRVVVSPFIASKHDLRAWYSQVAVFLMPSYSESFGLVVSEAMACGCAVVTSKTGLAAGLNSGEEALVVGTYDAPAYVDAVESLLADEGYRQRIAFQGHAAVQRLNWTVAGLELERFFLSLVVEPLGGSMSASPS